MFPFFLGPQTTSTEGLPRPLRDEYARIDKETFKAMNEVADSPLFRFNPPFGTPYNRIQRQLLWKQKDEMAEKMAAVLKSSVEYSTLLTNDHNYLKKANFIRDLEFYQNIATGSMTSLKYLDYASEVDRYGLTKDPAKLALAAVRRNHFGYETALHHFTADQKTDTEENFWRIILSTKDYVNSTNPINANAYRAAPKIFAKMMVETVKKPDIIYSAYNIDPNAPDFEEYIAIIENTWAMRDPGVDAMKEVQKKIARLIVLHQGVTTNLNRDIKAAKDSARELLMFAPNDPGLQVILNAADDAKLETLRAAVAQYKAGPLGTRIGAISSEPHKVLAANAT